MSAGESTRTRCSLALAAALLAIPAPAWASQPGPMAPPTKPLSYYLGDTSTAGQVYDPKTGRFRPGDKPRLPEKPHPIPEELRGWAFGPEITRKTDHDRPMDPYGPPPYDYGGKVFEYMARIKRMNAKGERKEIRGTCVSACTMYLGVRDICVAKNAMLWFHSAHYGGKEISELGNRIMEAHWPERVRQWAEESRAAWRVEFTLRRALSGVHLAAMGVPECNDLGN